MEKQDQFAPALHPQLVQKLLDHLESDDAFRARFQKSPESAMRELGYVDPWACMTLSSGTALASKQQIKSQRAKLQTSLTSVQQFDCKFADQTGL